MGEPDDTPTSHPTPRIDTALPALGARVEQHRIGPIERIRATTYRLFCAWRRGQIG